MGHVGGEAGPEAEVKFTPSGEMTKYNVESGSDWANDPITALEMGGGGGLMTGLAAKAGGAEGKEFRQVGIIRCRPPEGDQSGFVAYPHDRKRQVLAQRQQADRFDPLGPRIHQGFSGH